ncbi:MAG: alpha-hydroxy-acid oxidizing protein [Alphaproteobacteria bacterium]|nr:alpha-hydroxy-acid oxidizing protein [Alphaproteobacteria bacterium]
MNIDKAVNLDDLRRMAKKRLPKIAYDFIEGGAEDEDGIARNVDAFRAHRLVPRFMVDVSVRDQRARLFGRTYASPFGIAPTGLAGLFRPGADTMLAEAAREADIPFILSGNGTGTIDDLVRTAPENGWYQLYPAKDAHICDGMIKQARDGGLSTLVVTVDVPDSGNRERNTRNGFGRPLRMPWRTRLEAMRHPGWMIEYLRTGTPLFATWAPYAPEGSDADAVADFVVQRTHPPLTWADIQRWRDAWPRNFVLKGILHPDDARRAAEIGVDGIMVSNHGARQLDRAPAPIEVLPAIHEAVGDKVTLMLDGGVRRGTDVLTALCLGARFVFMGRPTLYATAAAGKPGAERAIAIMRREIDLAMAQLGCPAIDRLGPHFLMWDGPEDRLRNRRP